MRPLLTSCGIAVILMLSLTSGHSMEPGGFLLQPATDTGDLLRFNIWAALITVGLGVAVIAIITTLVKLYDWFGEASSNILAEDLSYLGFQDDGGPAYRAMKFKESKRQKPLNRVYAFLAYNSHLSKLMTSERTKLVQQEYANEAHAKFREQGTFYLWGDYATNDMRTDIRRAIALEKKLRVPKGDKPFPFAAYLFMVRDHTPENMKMSWRAWELGIRPDCVQLIAKCSDDEIQKLKKLPPDLIITLLR